ncbi:long-chain fatty acid--CoA ligase [Paraburkholderia ginsengiterrae]|uniref:Long-chain fatty acid--CoA ligase n=1 Tax=Paraburkholderia ginsengiterrae TaxID=1462993 RepID=A0A1A9N8L3_9BURK|nr:long-chain-fatty-acid--CoA ligase [Paraburkholderia ginsengiterrae]OAJ55023.1 long-chain fatty acid--CoA ligase [Paraburkholderia ginsengiterrae]OAJ61205.1 long-chain fatty acid--CoA ligase [Paraburkholderia ginsengiterrae]
MTATSLRQPDGMPRQLWAPQTSLYTNLDVSANRHPDKAAILYYGNSLSYGQLRREVEAMAGFLQQHCGVARGERVVLYMQNSPQFVIAFYAILRADAVVVPVNPMNRASELQHIFEDSGAKVAFAGEELMEHVRPLSGRHVDHVVVARYADYLRDQTDLPLPDMLTPAVEPAHASPAAGVIRWNDALSGGFLPSAHASGPEDLAVIPYTSGTTGRPKGCVHTHRSVMHSTVSCAEWPNLPDDSVLLCSVPLFHVTGMQNCMNMPLYIGATMAIMTRWDAQCAALLIERQRVSTWITVPTMVIDLLNLPGIDQFDLSSITYLSGGGAAMPQAVAQQIQDRWRIAYVEGYGLTETMAATHTNPPKHSKPQCMGVPVFNTYSLIVDPDTLVPLGGEILVSGPQVFEGYWNAPEASRDAFATIGGRRYLRTGDLGYVDRDGYFFVVDRLKRMINASGYKVWPAEVEAMLFEHPAIQEACVIATHDRRRGESVKAVIVLRHGACATEQEIVSWARQHMAAYKVPRVITFADSLPRTASGKIQWKQLQEAENQRGGA